MYYAGMRAYAYFSIVLIGHIYFLIKLEHYVTIQAQQFNLTPYYSIEINK